MDSKALHENGRQLQKAMEAGEPASTILNLLAPLEKWTASEDLLRSSKIGIVVAKLRTSKDPKVAAAGSSLVLKWKAAVKKKPVSPAVGKPAGSANGAAAASGTSSPAPSVAKKEVSQQPQRKFTVAPEKRSAKEDAVNTAVTGNAVRDGCTSLIYNGLCFMSEESPDDILEVSRQVEAAAFKEHAQETSAAYKTKMRSLHLNLKMKQNTWLRRDVFSGSIKPERFVVMTSDELKSEELKKQVEVLKKENMNNAMTPEQMKAISTTMTCGKCGKSRVAYTQAQTRSADEPMTNFCECTICGHMWKFS